MWTLDPRMAAALTRSHVRTARCDLLTDAAPAGDVRLIGGAVTIDAEADSRRSCQITIADPTGDLLSIFADPAARVRRELQLWRGVVLDDATRLEVPLGVFGIGRCRPIGGQRLEISGYDRARKVARARLTASYVIPYGTNYPTAIQTLISAGVSGLTFNFATVAYATPLIVANRGDDRWELATLMADAIGHELFFDAAGVCILRPQPDPTTGPLVATYRDDVSTSVLIGTARDLDDEHTYTHAVVAGEHPDLAAPVIGHAYDGDPGAVGFVDTPVFLVSALIATQAQADAAAAALIARKRGIEETATVDAVPNPAHEAGDVIEVVDVDTAVSGRYLLDRATMPVADGVMALTARTRRI
jgi:hypothetical protein